MLRKHGPVNVIVYLPKTEEGKKQLAQCVSDVHASAVNQKLTSLNCPTQQKLELLNAIIETVKSNSKEQT